MVITQPAPQSKLQTPPDQVTTWATAPFTQRATPTPPHPSPAPTPAPQRSRATSLCLLLPIRRAHTATAMERRRRRCWPRTRAKGEAIPCTARRTQVQWRVAKGIVTTVSRGDALKHVRSAHRLILIDLIFWYQTWEETHQVKEPSNSGFLPLHRLGGAAILGEPAELQHVPGLWRTEPGLVLWIQQHKLLVVTSWTALHTSLHHFMTLSRLFWRKKKSACCSVKLEFWLFVFHHSCSWTSDKRQLTDAGLSFGWRLPVLQYCSSCSCQHACQCVCFLTTLTGSVSLGLFQT